MIQKIKRKIHSYLRLDTAIKNISIQNRMEILNYLALNCKDEGITSEKYSKEDIIVSLTTYGKRLNQVYLTIESLMQQSLKPNKIILWLDDGYKNKRLPQLLKKQMDRGLEVDFCKDIRSYKKLIPTLLKYPKDVILTVDDDVFYEPNLLESFTSAYINDPHYIYFSRGHRMKLQKKREIAKYKKWDWCIASNQISTLNFPTGVGGVLYMPNALNKEVFNEEVFMDICPSADDVWFKAMALLNNKQCKRIETFSKNGCDYIENILVADVALTIQNVKQGRNDIQIKAVFDKYNLYDKLK